MNESRKTCIYCLRELDPGGFSTEHVIPELLGKFKNNLTLLKAVCRECNQYFGDHIEPVLAYGSGEAVRRLHYGIKPPERAGRLRPDRIQFAWRTEGRWDGALLQLIGEGDDLVVSLVPQVGFARKSSNGYVYVSEEDLADEAKSLPEDADGKLGIPIIFDSEETKRRLLGLLEKRGIPFKEREEGQAPPLEGPNLAVEIRTQLDKDILRCTAKIAFNYLVHIHGSELALQPDFNPIRRFVRYGEQAPYPLVVFDAEPILTEETRQMRQTNGHLVTIGWSPDRNHIVGQVGLFNEIRYRVSLACGFRGVWRELRSGHHFDIETMRTQSLLGTASWLGIPRRLMRSLIRRRRWI